MSLATIYKLKVSRVYLLTALAGDPRETDTFANSVDPDEMAHNDEPSHLDLHGFAFCS